MKEALAQPRLRRFWRLFQLLSLPLKGLPILNWVAFVLTLAGCYAFAEMDDSSRQPEYTINFHDVPVVEFIQFVGKIANVNFVFDKKDLHFNVTLSSGTPSSTDQILGALIQILKAHGFSVLHERGYLVIHRGSEELHELRHTGEVKAYADASLESLPFLGGQSPKFLVYKLQYHDGKEIEETIKKIAIDLTTKGEGGARYLGALQSVQWIKPTNSLVCSGDEASVASVEQLFRSLDTPLRQVFIEVLVVETDTHNASNFGLQWTASGPVNDQLRAGIGHLTSSSNPFANPSGSGPVSLGNGFDMGVIGDIILHKGRSFLSLGALVSALQSDGDSSVVLNQKIITQDNKNSTIFVGDTIPFTGSVVQTTGATQQTTANVEYRDVGVNLSITPRIGEGNTVNLYLEQQITEAIQTPPASNVEARGIQTTKTNMVTNMLVPDKRFFMVSGMARRAKRNFRAGPPCLGAFSSIGQWFGQRQQEEDKRNIMIFLRPQIINSAEDYQSLTDSQRTTHGQPSPEALLSEIK